MSNLAINDAGDVLAFDGQAWKPAPMAQNDAGERVVFDGAAWKPLGAMAGAAKGAKPQGRSDAAANAFGQGATLGFGDELAAGVRAAAPGISNFMMSGPALQRDESIGGSPTPQIVSTAPTLQGRYDEELARQRAQTKSDAQAYPTMTTAANIGGGVATTALALPNALMAGGGLLANVGRGAAVGAGIGGATGFGEGEGGFDKRLVNAGSGAAVGAVLGGGAPVVGKGIGYAYQKVAPLVLNKIADLAERLAPKVQAKSVSAAAPEGGQIVGDSFATQLADNARIAADNIEGNAATSRLALELSRSGGTRKAGAKLADLGDGAFIADTSEGAKRLANVGFILPGDAPDKYRAAFGARDREAGNRLVSTFEGEAPPPSSFALRGEGQAFDQHARAVGSRAYQGDMVGAGMKQTPELMALYENPYVDQALKHVMDVEKKSRIGRPDAVPSSPIEILHKVKQAIWDMGFDGATARPGPNMSYYRDLGTDFMNKLKAANPALAEADAVYSQAKSLPEHFDAGRAFLSRGSSEKATNASAPALADLLSRADPQQALAARAGATNAVRETALEGNRSARALAQRIDESAPVRDKLGELYGAPQAGRIVKQAAAERTFAETSNDVLRGPATAQRMASLADEAALGTVPHSPMSLMKMLAEQYQKVRAPSEAVRSRLADMLANPHASANAETLDLVAALLKRQAATRSYSSGLAGGAGGSFASSP